MQVLFVEDDAMNRRVVRDMLRVVGADMDEAPDAETGLAMIDRDDFNIILMDLRMPGMDVTADTAIDLREQCLASGADEVILKPVAMGALLSAMGRMVAKAQGDDVILS
jgi:CheY-like chemotaxis protein